MIGSSKITSVGTREVVSLLELGDQLDEESCSVISSDGVEALFKVGVVRILFGEKPSALNLENYLVYARSVDSLDVLDVRVLQLIILD